MVCISIAERCYSYDSTQPIDMPFLHHQHHRISSSTPSTTIATFVYILSHPLSSTLSHPPTFSITHTHLLSDLWSSRRVSDQDISLPWVHTLVSTVPISFDMPLWVCHTASLCPQPYDPWYL